MSDWKERCGLWLFGCRNCGREFLSLAFRPLHGWFYRKGDCCPFCESIYIRKIRFLSPPDNKKFVEEFDEENR